MDCATRRGGVIGAGVVGCATAYQLARAGLAVSLIERDTVAAHASGRNAGNLNPLQGTPAELLPLALQAFHLHAQIPDELHELGCGDRADADLSAQIHWIPQTADGRAVQPRGRV